jgi:hypothetical protein
MGRAELKFRWRSLNLLNLNSARTPGCHL